MKNYDIYAETDVLIAEVSFAFLYHNDISQLQSDSTVTDRVKDIAKNVIAVNKSNEIPYEITYNLRYDPQRCADTILVYKLTFYIDLTKCMVNIAKEKIKHIATYLSDILNRNPRVIFYEANRLDKI